MLVPALVLTSVEIHALTAGAIATMTLAVMVRAIKGHTKRALRGDIFTTLIKFTVPNKNLIVIRLSTQ